VGLTYVGHLSEKRFFMGDLLETLRRFKSKWTREVVVVRGTVVSVKA